MVPPIGASGSTMSPPLRTAEVSEDVPAIRQRRADAEEPFPHPAPVGTELIHGRVVERDATDLVCLGGLGARMAVDHGDRASDHQQSFVEVDVCPPEPAPCPRRHPVAAMTQR
jgi:hypothetical protein